jgi:hypothetical protein
MNRFIPFEKGKEVINFEKLNLSSNIFIIEKMDSHNLL